MFGLSKKKKEAEGPGQTVSVATWLGSKVNQGERWLVGQVERRSPGMSVRRKKLLLALFCLAFGGSSIGIIVNSLFFKDYKPPVVDYAPITMPVSPVPHDMRAPAEIITDEDYRQLRRFDAYCDSLRSTPAGARALDSILLSRPGLVDSVRAIEQMYLRERGKN